MKVEEFEALAKWWGNETDGFSTREENEHAWKVSLAEIQGRNYNLDCKNPHVGEQITHDPEVLFAQYHTMQQDIARLRNQLKTILGEALRD